jgi:toxin ParE1/3/4
VSLPVVLRPEASQDAEEARDYLDGQQVGLGQAFLARLNDVIGRIGAMPALYGVVWRDVRAARIAVARRVGPSAGGGERAVCGGKAFTTPWTWWSRR